MLCWNHSFEKAEKLKYYSQSKHSATSRHFLTCTELYLKAVVKDLCLFLGEHYVRLHCLSVYLFMLNSVCSVHNISLHWLFTSVIKDIFNPFCLINLNTLRYHALGSRESSANGVGFRLSIDSISNRLVSHSSKEQDLWLIILSWTLSIMAATPATNPSQLLPLGTVMEIFIVSRRDALLFV